MTIRDRLFRLLHTITAIKATACADQDSAGLDETELLASIETSAEQARDELLLAMEALAELPNRVLEAGADVEHRQPAGALPAGTRAKAKVKGRAAA